MSSRLSSESRVYATKAKDLNRQVQHLSSVLECWTFVICDHVWNLWDVFNNPFQKESCVYAHGFATFVWQFRCACRVADKIHM